MKDIRFNISLYVIVPVIFAGIAILSIIVTYNTTTYYLARALSPIRPVTYWSIALIVFTLVCGILIVKFLLDPMKRFFLRTKDLEVVKRMQEISDAPPAKDDMDKFAMVFDHVTELLSKVEARQLFPDIVGQSKIMRSVFNQIIKVAPSETTVLISGETGTGKELIARSIHRHSLRKKGPFIAINCAAIPEGLLESELFGHEKGAFTGADAKKPGKFELADGGTLFLDEIGDMPLNIQAKVLRAIEENVIERVGAVKPVKINVRFIAATNRELSQMVDADLFRRDLFYRLNVFPILLPPLRHRREDIPLLADRLLNERSKSLNISSEALQLLVAHDWPGNVRELKNVLESAAVLSQNNSIILPATLPSALARHSDPSLQEKAANGSTAMQQNGQEPPNLNQRVQDFERAIIVDALQQSKGVQVKAAALLGIKERSLWHRIKKFDIQTSDFKA